MNLFYLHLVTISLLIFLIVLSFNFIQRLIYKKRFTIVTGSKHFIGDEVEIAGIPCIVVKKGYADFEGYYKYIFREM